uniref:Uncharacterized protein n=1 Tax=Anguilla anguilla TaxID=7936 RepID=A0A0E9TET2_ANGAN
MATMFLYRCAIFK